MRLEQLIFLFCVGLVPHRSLATPSATVKPKVTAFVLASEGVPSKLRERILRRFAKALGKNTHLDVKDSDKLLAEFSGDIPAVKVQQLDTDHKAAVKLLMTGTAAEARTQLERVITGYESLLPFIRKRRMAHAQVALGVAMATLGKRREALATFSKLFVWRPRATYPPLFDTKIFPLFQRAQSKAKKLRRGSIELTTEPPGARAYVDGRFVGATPTVAFGLGVGRHYATFKKAGFVKGGLVVNVDPRRQQAFTAKLRQSEKFLVIQQSLADAERNLGQEEATPAMTDLRVVLFLDQVIFAKLQQTPEGLHVDAHLYDLRSKLRLNQARMTFDTKTLKPIDELARLVYVNVPYDGSVHAPPDAPPPTVVRRGRFSLLALRRWWCLWRCWCQEGPMHAPAGICVWRLQIRALTSHHPSNPAKSIRSPPSGAENALPSNVSSS
ncbi:MAG: PEGA domain-containing protein [Deltaproteobacteria bacterium]|nr:PEGA domain-containing protein [Deltaproteobacteria bacterium]